MQVGGSVQDLCRQCKMERVHTIVVLTPEAKPLRTRCDFCGSEHNYRGARAMSPSRSTGAPRSRAGTGGAIPIVTERERSNPAMSLENVPDLELLLRRVIREETGVTPVEPADKWHGGELVLRPGREGVQEKSIPIETFFQKIVSVRNRLRVLEQQINASDLGSAQKLKLQSYVTGAYGSLTSFNVLFADEGDRFKGSGK